MVARDRITEGITRDENQEQMGMQTDIAGTGDAAQPARIHSVNWFLISVVFNVAFMACLSFLLDQKVLDNIAPAFMAYKKKWAFLSHLGFIIIGSPICYASYAIFILLLNKATGRWVGFLKRAYMLAHEVVLYMTKDTILAHLVFSFHGCYFICFMKFITSQNKIQFIKVCTMEFARSALRFSFHGKWMSASFFLFTAFIGFLAMVNFDLMKNLPNAAGEVADNIADIVAD
nr:hypothetical protein CFP56_15995 [Quercus suber]